MVLLPWKKKNDIFEGKTYDYQTIVSNYDVQVGLKTIKNAGGGHKRLITK